MDAQLVNFYGVTEVSIDSTSYTCPPVQEIDFVRSGVPNYNTQIYVLDAWMQPLPFGARGEIYIGGDSVTRGYLRRPGKTAENFVPDPFRGDGSRLYRTGDLAQLLPDGNLKFLGRNDHQVKIRGIRVELLEIAAEIEAFEGVREAIVVSTGSGAEQGIVAYVTTDEDGINMGELRTALLNTMPIYMVPHSFVALDEFPINSNGKVDRSKLPSPKSRHSMSGRLPVGTTEEAIASIWRRHLGVQQVAADADFFSVGGNSLLAALVIADIREHFSTDLSLREWLDASTIEKLAMAIDRKKDGSIVQAAMNEVLDEFGM
jgi:putative non ribosomal peptide synthetase protein